MRTKAGIPVTRMPAGEPLEPPGAGRGRRTLPWSLWEKHSPTESLTLNLWPAELQEQVFLLCYASQWMAAGHNGPERRPQPPRRARERPYLAHVFSIVLGLDSRQLW